MNNPNRGGVRNTITWILLILFGICSFFLLLVSMLALEMASSFESFVNCLIGVMMNVFLVCICFKIAREKEKKGIIKIPTWMKLAKKKKPETITIDNSTQETVSGIVDGKEFDLLDRDDDGRIAIHEYYTLTEQEVLEKILKEDELFSKEKFYSWTRSIYQTLMRAFAEKNMALLRSFEEDALFIQHKQKIEEYIRNKETRNISKVFIKGVLLKDYHIEGNQQILVVALAASLRDYVTDEDGNVVRGMSRNAARKQYIMTFVRDKGVKTTSNSHLLATNCPNCGADVGILEDGKCNYCGSVVTTGKYGWVLLGFKEIKIIGDY